jgi:hypothetical protein
VNIDNQDAGIDHNFSIYDSFFQKRNYFKAPRITGPATETEQVGGLAPGRYYFQCDVHGPAMSGAFIVTPPGGGPPPPGPPPPPPPAASGTPQPPPS